MFEKKLTKYLAELSKLEFSERELERLTAEMSDIVALMDAVKGIDSSLETYTLPAVNYDNIRADVPTKSLKTAEIIANAKAVKNGAFTVPKVV
ncbi:MAG: Asp-tRNA(Asn)/Glu-tRNA(Gln) amidotransferase subunit GatC [Clostridia bacterium]|nr:Asp-tRNA(Asn)/Glu-tRNA(Gln) amidotransferase subunit GatC [Clostridia bacterium]